jgi:hypothetical protein
MKRMMAALAAAVMAIGCAFSVSQSFGAAPYKFISTASTNSNLVVAGDHKLMTVVAVNTTTTVYYLKFYDKSVAPTCNSDPVKFLIPIPFGASNAGGGAVVPFGIDGLDFTQGFGFCITGGSADNDNANAATGVTVSFAVK